jgi:hypothetical protein
VTTAGEIQCSSESIPISATFDLPSTRRFTLYRIVITRMPASSVLMRKRRCTNAVVSPASMPAQTARSVATRGFTPATISVAHKHAPSGKLPSLVRSGKASRRNGIITPSAMNAYRIPCASVTGTRFQKLARTSITRGAACRR